MKTIYHYRGLAGCVTQRRSRETGTLVGIYNTEQAQVDTSEPWATVCEKHGIIINHSTLALAREHAANPTGWCEQCREEQEAKAGKAGERDA